MWSGPRNVEPLAEAVMELYYKDLISEEESLDRLVDDLMLVVQGVDEFAEKTRQLGGPEKDEIWSRLQRLKAHCLQLKDHAVATAHATDKALRHHPYSSLGLAFGLGFATAWLLKKRR